MLEQTNCKDSGPAGKTAGARQSSGCAAQSEEAAANAREALSPSESDPQWLVRSGGGKSARISRHKSSSGNCNNSSSSLCYGDPGAVQLYSTAAALLPDAVATSVDRGSPLQLLSRCFLLCLPVHATPCGGWRTCTCCGVWRAARACIDAVCVSLWYLSGILTRDS